MNNNVTLSLDRVQSINPTRERVFELQAELQRKIAAGESIPADCPLIHTFSEGSYGRSIFIPKGSMLVGKTHRHRHLLIMSQGDVTITTGDGMRRMRGFNVYDSPAGIKRCVYAHEDTIITTVHITNETDLTRIEHEVIIPDADELLEAEIRANPAIDMRD
jgi:hypothetical protein